MSGGSRWLSSARAAHTRALGAAQGFPLLGDGAHTRRLHSSDGVAAAGDLAGAALAEARYRDWFTARATGEHAMIPRGTSYAAPPLTLAPDDVAPVQTRISLPPTRARAPLSGDRLAAAAMVIAGLVEEFGDTFPDECAAAVAWLRDSGAAP